MGDCKIERLGDLGKLEIGGVGIEEVQSRTFFVLSMI